MEHKVASSGLWGLLKDRVSTDFHAKPIRRVTWWPSADGTHSLTVWPRLAPHHTLRSSSLLISAQRCRLLVFTADERAQRGPVCWCMWSVTVTLKQAWIQSVAQQGLLHPLLCSEKKEGCCRRSVAGYSKLWVSTIIWEVKGVCSDRVTEKPQNWSKKLIVHKPTSTWFALFYFS